jgi:acyl carrier protein
MTGHPEYVEKVIEIVRLISKTQQEISPKSELVGDNKVLDSLLLVELCIRLEDLANLENFEFDWTSSEAMSKSKSMFRNIAALAAELSNQKNNQK